MALTGIELSAGILVGVNKPVEAKYGPYANVAAALDALPDNLRYLGLSVGILGSNGAVAEYWWRDGTDNESLVEKDPAVTVQSVTGLQTALDGKQPSGSYATLDSNNKVLTSQIPDLAITDFLGACANQAEMLARTGQKGDWVTRSDDGKVYVITNDPPSNASSWTALSYPVASPQVSSDWNATTGVEQIFNKPGNFGAPTPTTAGTAGFVPAPAAGDQAKYLKADGTWAGVGGTIESAVHATYFRSSALTQVLVNGQGIDVLFDRVADWSNGNGYITHTFGPGGNTKDLIVQQEGLYQLEFNASITPYTTTWNAGTNKVVSIDITRVGVTNEQVCIAQTAGTAAGYQYSQSASASYYLKVGDVINLRVLGHFSIGASTSAPTIDFLANEFDLNTWFSWRYISLQATTPAASNAAGTSLGTADAGVSTNYARADHIHPLPTAEGIGAEPTITTLALSKGGTGATTDEQARTNLGAAPSLAYSLINVWPRPNSLPNGDSDVVSANSGVSRFIECFPQQAYDNLYYKLKIPAAWQQASGDVLKILFKTDEPNRPLLLTVLAEIAPGDPGESPITGAVGSIRQGESLTLFRPPVVSVGQYSHGWIVESDNHTHQVFTPTTLVPGTAGFVPAPLDGDQNKFLKGNGTWSVGVSGADGDDGADGSTWFTGQSAPVSVPAAVEGDFYLQISNGAVYCFESASVSSGVVWHSKGSIKGPVGNGISSVSRTNGDGAAGTTDTYTITFTDSTTSTFEVANGNKWWVYGDNNPVPNEGRVGDYAITTGTLAIGQIWQKTENLGWSVIPDANIRGPQGNSGTNGTAVLSGTGNPQATQGVVGDFYINTSTKFIFGPKVTYDAWPAGTSLIGSQGPNGNTWFSGPTPPTSPSSFANNNDFYLDTNTGIVYKYNSAVWQPGANIRGPAGLPGLRKYGPIAVFQNYNQVFQNSSYNSSSSNGDTNSAFGSNLGGWGFFPVGNLANGFVVNPVDIFGPDAQYRIRVVIRQTGAFNDGIHCTIRRIIIGTGESTVAGLRDFSGTSNQGDAGAGVTEIHSRLSDTITTGPTAGWEYYRCYFAAKNGSGATPQDCAITLEQV